MFRSLPLQNGIYASVVPTLRHTSTAKIHTEHRAHRKDEWIQFYSWHEWHSHPFHTGVKWRTWFNEWNTWQKITNTCSVYVLLVLESFLLWQIQWNRSHLLFVEAETVSWALLRGCVLCCVSHEMAHRENYLRLFSARSFALCFLTSLSLLFDNKQIGTKEKLLRVYVWQQMTRKMRWKKRKIGVN